MKPKKGFMAENPPDGFGANMDKKYPMPTVKYTAGSYMLWAFFFLLEVLDILFRYVVLWFLEQLLWSKYQQIKKST